MKRILVVDDRDDLRLAITTLLEGEGYETIGAADGSVMSKVRGHRPDLVLLDVMMPVMDGFAALKQLKGDDATRDVPVVMMSAKGWPDVARRALALGAREFVPKPFVVDELLGLVARILGTEKLEPSAKGDADALA
ncbi:MAG: response regulator [Chloroflexi bacterium]|nr:response regulator [Chloroflexota bacterium]